MTAASPTVAEAKAHSDAARLRAKASVDELRARLAPKTLAQDIGEKGIAAFDRNAATITAVTAAGMLFLLRHRIASLFRRKPPAPPIRGKLS